MYLMSHRSKEVDRWISDNVKIVGSLNRFLSTTISIVVVLYPLGSSQIDDSGEAVSK